MHPSVHLAPLDDRLLDAVTAAAVTDADPPEVMPEVPGPPGWTPARVDAFRAFHRSRAAGLTSEAGSEVSLAVVADGQVVGCARLARVDAATLETGIWLGRSARGRTIGRQALLALVEEAGQRGASRLVADTTADNAGALAILRHAGATLAPGAEGAVYAELRPPSGPASPTT